ncbi:Colicin V production protein [Desulfonispora thiosulfatigenes DSM 11270]|uniref:Colicin V production protein n=1 Tax=Desulfonispora thiosulfatigenes DSM 11270 TaxID=656914 RepID=A0A1W1V2T9_DESTI|nr:CvpA family protein [Desulfonispora thiosulfatigenes]SMB87669.1 Colicin V production protein [Desulfonispora thiosulfatigenes DSM 11270]
MRFSLIDVLIILILFSGAYKGYYRGMVGSVFGLIKTILALIIANKYSKPIVGFLDERFGIIEKLYNLLHGKMPLALEGMTMPVVGNGSDMISIFINSMMLPEWIKEKLNIFALGSTELAKGLGISNMGDLLTYLIVVTLIKIIVFLLLWSFISSIISSISLMFTRKLDKLFLGKLNRIIGLVVGLALNSLIILVLVGMLTAYTAIIPDIGDNILAKIAGSINKSFLVPYYQAGFKLLFSKFISFI